MTRLVLVVWLVVFALVLTAQPASADCPACMARAAQFWPLVQAEVDSTSPALADYLSHNEIAHGQAADKSYFLTPDCGMEPWQLENVLESARQLSIHMTVFVMGSMIDKWPDESRALLQRLVADGHELALHSYSHRSFVNMPHDRIVDEVVRNWALIDWALGYHYPIRYIRMPYGARDNTVFRETGALGLQSVFWDIDSLGWYSWATPPIVQNQLLTRMRPGAIVVLHCSSLADRVALPLYVADLRQAGYEPALLSAHYARPTAANLVGYPRAVHVVAPAPAPAEPPALVITDAPAPATVDVDPQVERTLARLLELNR
jgi:peptidoglycan/xylan/chitin deacetylase (PgdA/CDA1 family)